MKIARLILLGLVVGCAAGHEPRSQASTRTEPVVFDVGIGETADAIAPEVPRASATEAMPAGQVPRRERALIDESAAALEASDYATARAKAAEAVEGLLASPEADRDEDWLALLDRAGRSAWLARDARTANSAWAKLHDVRSDVLPDDHPDLQEARLHLALTVGALGDLTGERAIEEKVLEVRRANLPDDHADLQAARSNLATTIRALGDLAGARALQEKVLGVFSRTLPDDHADLQRARGNLAITIKAQGDLAGARVLEEKVLEVFSRTLPDDHPDLQAARGNLAMTIKVLGDLRGARALEEKMLEVFSRTLPDDHPALQSVRQNLAITIETLGDLAGARALEEKVLEVRSAALPEDHRDLQAARLNLAANRKIQGDLAEARVLEEQVLEVFSRTLPDDHPDLQVARQCLAVTLATLGDLAGARVLQEQVLEVLSRTLPDDYPDLQAARQNLALTLASLGDLAGARALEVKVLEVRLAALPDDHPDLQQARLNLAATIEAMGDPAGARALEEPVLEVLSRTLPDDHVDLQRVRHNLARTLDALGDHSGARTLQEQVLEGFSRTLPDDHPDLQAARENLAVTIACLAGGPSTSFGEEDPGRERCAELLLARARAQTRAARTALLESSVREAEARCVELGKGLDLALSFASGYGVFDPIPELDRASFVLGGTTRGAALGSAALMRRAAGVPRYADLRERLRRQSEELAAMVSTGTTSLEFQAALVARESTQRELMNLGREISGGGLAALDFDVDHLSAGLGTDEAVVGYRRYERSYVENGTKHFVDSLCALVLRRGEARAGTQAESGRVTRIELGPFESIETVVGGWRDAIGAGFERGVGVSPEHAQRERLLGEELRRLVFDPLVPALAGAEHVVLALDDVLHLVPIDALPMSDSLEGKDVAVGDRWRMETRCTIAELLAPAAPRTSGVLVAFGGASFNSEPLDPDAEDSTPIEDPAPGRVQVATILRGTIWERGFSPLTYTGLEAREIVVLHDEVAEDDTRSIVLEKRKASRAALEAFAPKARWLHVATHGWFAPESIRSWEDSEPLDKFTGLGFRKSGEEQVRGMSPMLLTGLALAGANLPENELGRAPGLITAEEIAALDLSHCELAVLSACDTARGEMRRAGQGVASLQMALQMAGARSVITSLWKVPDEATEELMLDFYRRLWVEKKPKWRALWEAKRRLRDAEDERGNPKYSTRDWAAWVLTGESD